MSDETPRRTGTTDGLDEALDLSPGRFLHAIYALFHNKAFGLILILLTGLLSLIGALLPQKPSSIAGDSERQAAWLDRVRDSVGGWTSILDALGFFSMFSSIPFLVVMGLLGPFDHRLYHAPDSRYLESSPSSPCPRQGQVLRCRRASHSIHHIAGTR